MINNSRCWHRRELYAEKIEASLKIAVAQNVGHNRQFIEMWKPKAPQNSAESEDENDQNEAVLKMKSMVTVVMLSRRIQVNYTAIKVDWFTEYTKSKMGEPHGYILERLLAATA